jgi:mannose-6-phosphate isomerase-like protein (cupin superfamily)
MMIMNLKFTRISKDARGEIYNLNIPANNVINIQTTNEGYARGGHSHTYDEIFLVVTGLVEYHTGTEKKERVRKFTAGSIIRTTPNEPHYLMAKEFSVLVEVRPGGTEYSPKDYKPFRDKVLGLIEKRPARA